MLEQELELLELKIFRSSRPRWMNLLSGLIGLSRLYLVLGRQLWKDCNEDEEWLVRVLYWKREQSKK